MSALDDEVARVPAEYRRAVARWLLDRAGWYRPSWLLPAPVAAHVQQALAGAAADLSDPGSEDSTVGHARALLADLGRSEAQR